MGERFWRAMGKGGYGRVRLRLGRGERVSKKGRDGKERKGNSGEMDRGGGA